MDNWLVILGVGFLILIAVLPFLPIGTRPRCPECGSRKIGVQKTATGMRDSDFGGGGPGGGGGRAPMQDGGKYRWNNRPAQGAPPAPETR